jgi:hypothetical protein
MGTWLMANHHFLAYAEQQKKEQFLRLDPQAIDSPGLRMGILGYGAIGRQCARLGQALGMEVYAYTRSEKATPESRQDDSYCVPKTGDPDGLIPTKWFHGGSKEAVNEFLAQDGSDHAHSRPGAIRDPVQKEDIYLEHCARTAHRHGRAS